MPAAQVNFDDIDLDMEPEDELSKFMSDEPEAEEEAKEEDTEGEETEEEASDDEVIAEAEEAEEPAKPEDKTKAELEEIRAERARLQEQLNELTVSSMMTQKQLKEMAKAQEAAAKKPEKEPEPEGPTPEQILQHVDQRIAETDAALTKAEIEDPNAAAGLRQQLRQLERYYTTLQSQIQLSSVKTPDPEVLIQKAATEAQQQAKFSTVKRTITSEYPVLDTKSEYFNEELRDAVHRIYNPMIREGADPTEALIEATALVMRANGVYSMSEWQAHVAKEEATKAAAEAAEAAAAAKAAKKTAGAARKEESVQRNVKAAKDIPPNIAPTGKSNEPNGILDKYDFGKMSINEMMRINDEELERVESALALYE